MSDFYAERAFSLSTEGHSLAFRGDLLGDIFACSCGWYCTGGIRMLGSLQPTCILDDMVDRHMYEVKMESVA